MEGHLPLRDIRQITRITSSFKWRRIYAAVAQKKIVYNNPPASYEVIGQRVRLPHIVLEQKMGTCLDLSLLYAACLEAVGLFPILVFIKGHAFCGCHLEGETFADCVVDDVSAIEKRIVAGAEELLLVECTDFVDGGELDFDRALKHGKDHLLNISNFICAIDILRTRGQRDKTYPPAYRIVVFGSAAFR